MDREETGTFSELKLDLVYRTNPGATNDILTAFYIPVLERAREFHCVAGYFRSSFISSAAAGVSRFIYNGGSMRLLLNTDVQEHDVKALTGEIDIEGTFAERLRADLVPANDIEKQRLEVLAWLFREGRLDVRIAIRYHDGKPLLAEPGTALPIQHSKYGYFLDADKGCIAFSGSANVSSTAMERNYEKIDVYSSEGHGREYAEQQVEEFRNDWEGHISGYRVFPLPKAVQDKLFRYAPLDPPSLYDALEPHPAVSYGPPEDAIVAARASVVRYAPRFPGAIGLAEATSAVSLQPHQRQVSYRLADQYPRSWIVADEVGLGKTISAGMSLRRLLLSGQVKRALILAPANLRQNWQNELFEKFGLWVPRLVDGTLVGPDPKAEPSRIGPHENPFALAPIIIVSSHLARRAKQTSQILDVARQQPYDLIIVDEAHHARYKGIIKAQKQEANRLLTLLQNIKEQRAARALWLLTATPLQTNVTDLHALLKVVGLEDTFDDLARFERYYEQIVKQQPSWLSMQNTGKPYWQQRELDPDEHAFLERIKSDAKVVASNRERILAFTAGTKGPKETVEHSSFDEASMTALRQWLRLRGPVERHVTRHTRETLREYQRLGLITAPLANRNVSTPDIAFTDQESELLTRLEGYILRLMQTSEGNHRAKFVVEIYQQRLTSSWAAIEQSLQARLDRTPLDLAEDDDDDDDDDQTIDHTGIIPLTQAEAGEIGAYIQELREVQNADSKFAFLGKCIDEARKSGRRIIIFTQYVDTLNYLLSRIKPTLENVLATYTGDGGRIFKDGAEQKISKFELVQAVQFERVQIILATDAAAEGLNLQTCSYLVNYDMPWNPMRVEQRIGRIDRLGQPHEKIIIKNLFVSNAERHRYRALADRIQDFNTFIGGLPPILGIVEPTFIQRPYVELQSSLEDQLPVPQRGNTPLRHDDFVEVARDELHALSDARSVAWVLAEASADPENWAAPATYGHPALNRDLGKVPIPESLVVATSESGVAVLARTDGKEPSIISSLADIDGLGEPADTEHAGLIAREAVRSEELRRLSAQAVEFQGAPDTRRELLKVELVGLLKAAIRLTMSYASITNGVSLKASEAYERMGHTEAASGSLIFPAMTLAEMLGIAKSELFGHQTLAQINASTYHAEHEKLEAKAAEIISRYKSFSA